MNRVLCGVAGLAAVIAGAPAGAGAAQVDGPVCEPIGPGQMAIDGLLDEWRGMQPHRVGGMSRDASFSLRCAYDQKQLYVSVDIRDQRVLRGRGSRPKAGREDHLRVRLGTAEGKAGDLVVFPAVAGQVSARTWNRRKIPAWLQAEDTLQEHGWSLELAVPMQRIAGLGPGSPGLEVRVDYGDADGPGAGKSERVGFAGRLVFRAGAEAWQAFLQAAKLAPADIRVDVLANVDDTPGAERVVAGGTVIGVVSDRYTYITLPVQSAREVSKVEVVDLRGDGTASIVTEFRQHGDGASRDLLVVWGLSGRGSFARVLAVEVRRERGGRVLANRWSLAPRGVLRGVSGQGAGRDLVVEVSAADVRGWSQATYRETADPDVRALLTPWSDATSAVYYFDGNVALGGDPKVKNPARKRRR